MQINKVFVEVQFQFKNVLRLVCSFHFFFFVFTFKNEKNMQIKNLKNQSTYLPSPVFVVNFSDWNKLWCNVSLNNQLSDTIASPYSVLLVGKIEKDCTHFTTIIPISRSTVNYDITFYQPRSTCNLPIKSLRYSVSQIKCNRFSTKGFIVLVSAA